MGEKIGFAFMKDDKTVWLKPPKPVLVEVEGGKVTGQPAKPFLESFKIGRDSNCQVRIENPSVSREHLEVRYQNGEWTVCDLNSANGVYLNGRRIKEFSLEQPARITLGEGGVVVHLRKEGDSAAENPSATQIIDRYMKRDPKEEMGDHTQAIHLAFKRVQKKQSKKYFVVIGLFALILAGAVGVVFFQNSKLDRMRQMSQEMFYSMKSLEIQLAQVEDVVVFSADPAKRGEIAKKREALQEMTKNYESFVQEAGLYKKNMTEQEQLIFKMARIFGECEITMPPEFMQEVQSYIKKWQSSGRLVRAVQRAKENGYPSRVTEQMLQNHLPPQFFYLGLQESDYDDHAVGPRTRFGIAKGIWQFIPTTAAEYGLKTGPLLEIPRYDPRDERYDFNKMTAAAALYIKKIYNTEAAASGLLVIASYNWGENNIRQIILKMPDNPRERNFWKLLNQHKIPVETYDYVFYTFSAAVIGENPRLFGFDFDNPLPRLG
jgi:membrane-bound lytic murein transglycosylase D